MFQTREGWLAKPYGFIVFGGLAVMAMPGIAVDP